MTSITELQVQQKIARLQLQQKHIEEMKTLKESQEKEMKELREKIQQG